MTFDPCPRCGRDVGAVVATDPGIETMSPCGCRLAVDGGQEIKDDDRDDQTVWVPKNRAGGSYSVYHTDPECTRLQSADRVKEKLRRHVSLRLRICRECDGKACYGASADHSTHQALQDADPGDLITDGGRDR